MLKNVGENPIFPNFLSASKIKIRMHAQRDRVRLTVD